MGGLIKRLSQKPPVLLAFGVFLILLTIIQWWRDVIRESSLMGHHTSEVVSAHRWGMLLLIVSELFFFFFFGRSFIEPGQFPQTSGVFDRQLVLKPFALSTFPYLILVSFFLQVLQFLGLSIGLSVVIRVELFRGLLLQFFLEFH